MSNLTATARRARRALRTDLSSSIVVFLVALPLCVGVAAASGVPPELGLVTGIVGGIVTGLLPGSTLQVSGPAAGLTVLVFETVQSHGLGVLGIVVLGAGLLQTVLGAVGVGRWFRAISVSVVEGMLAGIGLLIIVGQLYAMVDRKAPAAGLDKITRLPGLLDDIFRSDRASTSLALGAMTIVVLVYWRRIPRIGRAVPGALAAVVLASVLSAVLSLPVQTLDVHGLGASLQVPSLADLDAFASAEVLGAIVVFTLIASAESLFSAAAVDRLHDLPRTDYDKELMAQGVGNTVCGLLGALPLTAVIVRSAANVQAGARTKASRVLHGVWLLLFATLLPGVLELIPIAAVAGVLVHAGVKLLPLKHVVPLARSQRGEALILVVTAVAIVCVSLFEGVLIGLGLSLVKTAWDASRVTVTVTDDDHLVVHLAGAATFLRLPKVLDALEGLPADRDVTLDVSGLRHQDHASTVALHHWADRHERATIRTHGSPGTAPHRKPVSPGSSSPRSRRPPGGPETPRR
jgi:MFS superfamily sulfate permease-like transporter